MRRLRLLSCRLIPGLLLASAAGLLVAGGCTQSPLNTSLRALEESGRVSFVCLGSPSDAQVVQPLEQCRNVSAPYNNDFSGGGSGGVGGGSAGSGGGGASSSSGTIPHLYALVTQTFRGEIAVIDLTTTGNDALIDQDPTIPGPNFLPMGGQPTGIVSTPGSTASFVTVAEVGREAIFAIPSDLLVRRTPSESVSSMKPPHLSDWPGCRLPAAPGEPMLLNDPLDDQGRERVTCDDDYTAPATDGRFGALTDEGHGRVKIAVPLPSLGGIGILDAQAILDTHNDDALHKNDDGTYKFDACVFDRWVKLDDHVELYPPPQPDKPPGVSCVKPEIKLPTPPASDPQPAGMTKGGDTLYVADLALPLIHRLDVKSPCEPVELPALTPFAAEDPSRVVTTSRVAVTAEPTAGLKRFLYADDVGEGTVMVFDVSDGSTTMTPLVRPHAEWTPLTPRDRIRFVSAPRDLIVAQRDVAQDATGNGVATEGVFCDPNPRDCSQFSGTKPFRYWNGTTCTPGAPGVIYQTASDYTSGAGPFKLRGTFGFVLLTNGQLEIIDIEDLDAPCRAPAQPDALLGCDVPTCTKANPTCADNWVCPTFDSSEADTAVHPCLVPQCKYSGIKGDTCPSTLACPVPDVEQNDASDHGQYSCRQASSSEDSCNTVQTNTLRSSVYVVNDEQVGNNSPGITQLPIAFDKNGAFQDPTVDATVPQLRATMPIGGGVPTVSVAGSILQTDEHGAPIDGDGNMIALNLETPRAQNVNQTWTVTFEGPLPRLGLVAAELRVGAGTTADGLYDSSAEYCDSGVLGRLAARDQLEAEGVMEPDLSGEADDRADLIELINAIPEQDDPYWKIAPIKDENHPELHTCTFDICNALFGDPESPPPTRDFLIEEAYQDHLELVDTAATVKDADGTSMTGLQAARCCFPTFLNYAVRPGDQWTVVGGSSGLLHHVVTDPATGACRTSCDPVKSRQNGRAKRSANGLLKESVKDGSATAFINQVLRFAVLDGAATQPDYKRRDGKKDPNRPLRDTQFRVTTTGSFSPLTITLLKDTRDVAPVGITFIPPTGELAVTDGALQGLLTVSLSNVDTNRQYY